MRVCPSMLRPRSGRNSNPGLVNSSVFLIDPVAATGDEN
jgi:hypothetical protein